MNFNAMSYDDESQFRFQLDKLKSFGSVEQYIKIEKRADNNAFEPQLYPVGSWLNRLIRYFYKPIDERLVAITDFAINLLSNNEEFINEEDIKIVEKIIKKSNNDLIQTKFKPFLSTDWETRKKINRFNSFYNDIKDKCKTLITETIAEGNKEAEKIIKEAEDKKATFYQRAKKNLVHLVSALESEFSIKKAREIAKTEEIVDEIIKSGKQKAETLIAMAEQEFNATQAAKETYCQDKLDTIIHFVDGKCLIVANFVLDSIGFLGNQTSKVMKKDKLLPIDEQKIKYVCDLKGFEHITYEHTKLLIDTLNDDELKILDGENILDLYDLSITLSCKEMVQQCLNYFTQNCTPEDVIQLLNVRNNLDISDPLIQTCLNYLASDKGYRDYLNNKPSEILHHKKVIELYDLSNKLSLTNIKFHWQGYFIDHCTVDIAIEFLNSRNKADASDSLIHAACLYLSTHASDSDLVKLVSTNHTSTITTIKDKMKENEKVYTCNLETYRHNTASKVCLDSPDKSYPRHYNPTVYASSGARGSGGGRPPPWADIPVARDDFLDKLLRKTNVLKFGSFSSLTPKFELEHSYNHSILTDLYTLTITELSIGRNAPTESEFLNQVHQKAAKVKLEKIQQAQSKADEIAASVEQASKTYNEEQLKLVETRLEQELEHDIKKLIQDAEAKASGLIKQATDQANSIQLKTAIIQGKIKTMEKKYNHWLEEQHKITLPTANSLSV